MKSVQSLLFFKPMKEEPEEHHWSTMDSYKMNLKIMQTSKGPYLRVSHTIKENPMEDGVQWIRLPYLVGEKCYVRETWRIGAWAENDGDFCIDYKDGPRKQWLHVDGDDYDQFERLWIESCDDADKAGIKVNDEGRYEWEQGQSPCRWRSPVTMPQWAARRYVRIL